ncbi:hypothetical protein J0H58_00555 [bacterium]|nr:hypothetical protein [bacterium]
MIRCWCCEVRLGHSLDPCDCDAGYDNRCGLCLDCCPCCPCDPRPIVVTAPDPDPHPDPPGDADPGG